MKTTTFLAGIILVAGLSNCRKIIDPKNLPQQAPQMVINAIVTSGDTLRANISLSRSIVSGKDYKYVSNAVCSVYEDGVFLQTLSYRSNGDYIGTTSPKPGKRYLFKVDAPGYTSISGESTVPEDPKITPVQHYDTVNSVYNRTFYDGQSDSYITGVTKFRFSITDDPNVSNYYSVTATVIALDSLYRPIDYSINYNINTNNNGGLLNNQELYGSTIDFDDQNIVNGNQIQVDIGVNVNITEVVTRLPVKTIIVALQLHSISAEYYKYKQTVINQTTSGVSLFAEPVQIFSNVSDGMGIVAGDNSMEIGDFECGVMDKH